MRCWYLVHTKPAREALAQSHLERQGFSVYQPRIAPLARKGGLAGPGHSLATAGHSAPAQRPSPLFPRYLFLQLEVGRQGLAPVRSTIGVSGVVRFGGEYAVVPESVIDGLKERADPVTGLHHLAAAEQWVPGSQLRVVAGAFDGLDGVFHRHLADERVVILLNLLGRHTPVQIPASFVESSIVTRCRPSAWSGHA